MNRLTDRSLRESYINDLKGIVPLDDIEQRDLEMALLWLKTAKSVHKPNNMDEHLGVICLVLSPDRHQTFLLSHRKAQMWLPPGGHVDAGLTFRQAASLELREEMGQDALFISEVPFFLTRVRTRGLNAGHIDVTAWYLVEARSDVAYTVMQKEASDARWFQIEDLQSMTVVSNLPRAYAKLLRQLNIYY